MSADPSPYLPALQRTWLLERPGRTADLLTGTLVFADVSGFTPLTERLARKGKVGAEELTDTLNLVFSGLLEVAAAGGGDCLKFGGDALLLLFTGEGHAGRAIAAAHGMQDALRALRRDQPTVGRARLAISMGVHGGEILAVMAGRAHRELLVLGPTVSEALEREAAAGPGEVQVSPTTRSAATAAPDAAPRPDALPGHADAAPAAPLEAGIPVPLRGHLDGRAKEGEHRLAAIGFVKVGATDALLADLGPEVFAEALDASIQVVQEACAEHDVTFLATDVDLDAVKVILATGVPSAAADDEGRLLLALRQVVDRHRNLALPVRAGAHRGRVFAVDVGSHGRRGFTVMGDAVNLAARVMGHAGWGQVVATDDLVDRSETSFERSVLPPFLVKGKTAPVAASVVGPAVGRRTGAAPSAPLVGRAREVEVLRRGYDAARAGRGVVVEVEGEAGIGKSRLVAHARALGAGLPEVAVAAGRYSLATPYFALRAGLRGALGLAPDAADVDVEGALAGAVGALAPDLLPWLPLLGVPFGLQLADNEATAPLDAGQRQSTLQPAFTELLGRLLPGPTAFIVEDAHWLDAASSDLLASAFARVGERPWVVVVTRRPSGGGLAFEETTPVERVALTALDHGALLELAALTAGDAVLPPGAVEQLVARSGGNPLFLEELVRATVDGAVTELPETVEAVVAASIDTLHADDRALLRHASVLGARASLRVLHQMLDLPPEAIAAAVGRLGHFLAPGARGDLEFRHVLLRDVAYEGLPFRVRRALHERAGRIIERSTREPDAAAELLSIHFHRAGAHGPAWRYARVAGARARRSGAPLEAAAFFEQALESGLRLDGLDAAALAQVAEDLGDVCELTGRYGHASAAYLQARKLAPADAIRLARLCRKLGYVRDHEGRYQAADRWFVRGLAELDGAPGAHGAELRVELTTAAVSSRIRQGRYRGAVPRIEEAIRLARDHRVDGALAHAYFVYDQLLVDQGRYAEANHSERAAEIYEGLGDHRGAAAAYNEMGNTAYWLGRWDHAVSCYERAIEADRRAGALVYNAIYLNNIGEIRSDQGRWAEARSLLEAAYDLWTSGGWRIGSGWALSNLGRLAARDGRLDDAAEQLAEAAGVLAGIGADTLLVETETRQAERLVLAGDPEGALALVPALRERAQRLDVANVLYLLDRVCGYGLAQHGRVDDGWERLEACLAATRAAGAAYEVALTLEAMGRIAALAGRAADGAEEEAAAVFQRLGVVATPSVPLPGRQAASVADHRPDPDRSTRAT